MKKILFTLLAVIPALGFAQQAPQQAGKTAQNANQIHAVKATTVKTEVAPAPVVLTEEQQHAVWLKNNTQYKTMSKVELTNVIQEFETKYSNSSNNTPYHKKEILWMKEILSAK